MRNRFYVIPADARPLVAAGRVDRRLFDVTTLLEFGYDDASRATVPLIVTGQGARTGLRSAATRDLPAVNGIALDASKQGATWQALTGGAARSGVDRIWLDGVVRASLDRSVPRIGAPAAWAAGFTGAGVTVAVLDTGVDETHPDLAGRQVAEKNFSNAADVVDRHGHGTHVASTVAGTGAKSNGTYRGVAHGASIVDGKVLNDRGSGTLSGIVAGMQWAVEQGADVVNVSAGAPDSPEIDPVEEAVNTLSAQHGTLFVVAAGNSGPEAATIDSPGSADAALTVGAVDRDDNLAGFSSRGPRTGDGAIKPDITAPGVDIVAAKAAHGHAGVPAGDGYVSMRGTSMATPHVAGAAALLAQQHPDWTGAQLKAVLSASAKPTDGLTPFEQGAGRVDVARAIAQTILTEPTNLGFGTVAWPHHDDEPVSKPLTYRNPGTTDVTLTLTTETSAPDGMFSLSTNEITVPAGGSAQVTVTADTRVGDTDGSFTGAVVATAGDTSARTPLAIEREVESYDLTLDHVDDNGAPTARYETLVFGTDNDTFESPYEEDGSVTVRLPKGRYLLDSRVTTTRSGADHVNLIVRPDLVLDGDTTITVDPRPAKPISVTPPAPATLALGEVGYEVRGRLVNYLTTTDLSTVSTANVGPPLPDDGLIAWVNTQWDGQDGSFYGLAWFSTGALPTGFTKVVDKRDLATINADYGSTAPNRTGQLMLFPHPASELGFARGIPRNVSLPAKRTEYVNTDGGVRWSSSLDQFNGSAPESLQYWRVRTYRAGRTYTERHNYAVFGPTLPDNGYPRGFASRAGDEISMNVELFGDSGGNAGKSVTESAVMRLYRGDELIGESPGIWGTFEVPPEEADYRVRVEVTRPDLFDLSTAVSVEWTFRSGHVDRHPEPTPLPISVVRFLPKLDAANTAPAGKRYVIPVQLQCNGGHIVRPKKLAVEVSYDEGKTWQRAEVQNLAAVKLNHPAGATSVSLRATATAPDGNTVKQTIIRAYKLRN